MNPVQKALRRFYGLDRPDTKANRAQHLETPYYGAGMAGPKFHDYRSYLLAYKVPWVHKCITVISENCANIEYTLVKSGKAGDEDTVIDTSPLLDLLHHPNAQQNGHELIEAIFTDAELTGNAFLSLEEQNGRGEPGELYRLNPANVIIHPDPKSLVGGYTYSANGGKEDYLPNEIWHFKYPNPTDDLYGMGIIEAAEAIIDSEMAMSEHMRQFWRNGAKITGVFTTDTVLDTDVFTRVGTGIRNLFRGAGYSTVLLESGINYTPISDGPAKLGMLEMAHMSRDFILAIFGVPPTKVGILDNANYKAQSADEYFWSETIMPKLTRLENSIQPLVELFHPGQGLRLQFTRLNFEDDLPAAQVAEVMTRQGVFTIDEIRVYQGAEPLAEGGDAIMVDANRVPFDPKGALATVNEIRNIQGDPSIPGGDDMIIVRGRAEAFNLATVPPIPPVPAIGGGPPPAFPPMGNTPPQLPPTTGKSLRTGANAPASALVLARERDAVTEYAKGALTSGVSRFMAAQELRVTAKVLGHKSNKAALSGEDFLDADDDAALAATLAAVYGYATTKGYEAANTLGLAVQPDDAALAVTHAGYTGRIAGINETTRVAIGEQIAEGLRRAYSAKQIAEGVPTEQYRGVAGVFAEAKTSRAETIARTEASTAFNSALTFAYRQSGRVRYVEALDGIGDADGAARNGTVYPLDAAATIEDHPNGSLTWAPLIG